MQLHAANALVATRSSGARVPGFEVVARQMRQLSHELNACLVELRIAMACWLETVSHHTADERSLSMLARAAAMSRVSERIAAPIVADLKRRATAGATDTRTRRMFLSVLDDARRLAATGCILARTAKLEAAYGASLEVRLTESAASFTELADSVDESVRTIARRLTDRRWSQP